MNFLTMQQELSDRLGAYDQTIAADATKLKRWLNMAQQDITSRQNWSFMLAHEIIQTVLEITAGTVAVAAAGTTVTFTSGPPASTTDYFIQFGNETSWYKVSAHTAAAVTATITPAYGGTSNLTASTYKLRKLFYATSTPLDSILDVKKTASGRFLEIANARETDVFLPLYWGTGDIYKYIPSIPDSTGGTRISFIYLPSAIENIQVRGIKKLTDLSSDSDISIIPSRWHSTVLDLGSFYGFASIDDTRSKDFFQKAEIGINSMAETYDQDLGRMRVSRSLESGISEGPAYMLPSTYGMPQT